MSDGKAHSPTEDLGMFGVKGSPKNLTDKGSASVGGHPEQSPVAPAKSVDGALSEMGGLHSKSKISSVEKHEEGVDIPKAGFQNTANKV